MNNDLFLIINSLSIETIIIGIFTFLLTMLVKIPIKKFTAKFNEDKRKALNSIIILIPALISAFLTILYYGLFQNVWFETNSFSTTLVSYLLALVSFAFFNRIIILIKSIKTKNDKSSTTEIMNAINDLKSEVSNLSKFFDFNETNLNLIEEKLKNLTALKLSLLNNELQSINDNYDQINQENNIITDNQNIL